MVSTMKLATPTDYLNCEHLGSMYAFPILLLGLQQAWSQSTLEKDYAFFIPFEERDVRKKLEGEVRYALIIFGL